MHPSFLRVLLATDATRPAAPLEEYLREAGHEIIVVEARGDVVLKAARLLHPDLIIHTGLLPSPLDGVALAAALQAPGQKLVPVVLVTDPSELPALLTLQVRSTLTATGPESAAPDSAADTTPAEAA